MQGTGRTAPNDLLCLITGVTDGTHLNNPASQGGAWEVHGDEGNNRRCSHGGVDLRHDPGDCQQMPLSCIQGSSRKGRKEHHQPGPPPEVQRRNILSSLLLDSLHIDLMMVMARRRLWMAGIRLDANGIRFLLGRHGEERCKGGTDLYLGTISPTTADGSAGQLYTDSAQKREAGS